MVLEGQSKFLLTDLSDLLTAYEFCDDMLGILDALEGELCDLEQMDGFLDQKAEVEEPLAIEG